VKRRRELISHPDLPIRPDLHQTNHCVGPLQQSGSSALSLCVSLSARACVGCVAAVSHLEQVRLRGRCRVTVPHHASQRGAPRVAAQVAVQQQQSLAALGALLRRLVLQHAELREHQRRRSAVAELLCGGRLLPAKPHRRRLAAAHKRNDVSGAAWLQDATKRARSAACATSLGSHVSSTVQHCWLVYIARLIDTRARWQLVATREWGSHNAQPAQTHVRFCRYRFEFQSNLVWDSIKSISNFCFQF
jgi:hypothetical protein